MDISLYDMISNEYAELATVNTVDMMNAISHQIEDAVIQHEMPVDFFAGFERFSNFPHQMRRYQRLGRVARRVYIFGVPDVSPPPIAGIEYKPLSATNALSREWFVVVNTPDFWTALLTQELDGRDSQGRRRFRGLWTYNEEVVERAYLLLCQSLNMPYRPVKQRNYQKQSEVLAGISRQLIAGMDQATSSAQRRWKQLATLHQVMQLVQQENDPSKLLEGVVQTLHTTFGAHSVVMARWRADGNISVEAQAGAVGQPFNTVEGTPVYRAVRENRAILIPDLQASDDREPMLPMARSLLVVPLMNQKEALGILAVGSQRAQDWDEDDVRTVSAVGAVLSYTLSQLSGGDAQAKLVRIERGLHTVRKQVLSLSSLLMRMESTGPYTRPQQALLNQVLDARDSVAAVFGLPNTLPRRIQGQANTGDAAER